MHTGAGETESDGLRWEDTPERQALLRRIEQQDTEIELLRDLCARLTARVEELEAKLRLNSGNSSKPPSSDSPGVKLPPKKKPSGRRPGGQPGHKGSKRDLLPPERVDKSEDCWPDECEACSDRLPRYLRCEVGEPVRHQVIDVPPARAEVTEYVLHAQICNCGHTTQARLPDGVPRGAFGPRLQAVVSLLTGAYRISKRTAVEALGDLFAVKLSVGSVSNAEQSMSQALSRPVEHARQHVQTQPVVNADETGWREGRRRAWLWIAATPLVAIFLIHSRRSAKAAAALLGRFAGVLTTDRWSAYSAWPEGKRQFCWAHLLRDFEFIAQSKGTARKVGRELVALTKTMFRKWHRVRDGTLSHAGFRRAVGPMKLVFEGLLKRGVGCPAPKVSGMCEEILASFEAMWTFTKVPGIEPTNNLAERCLRAGVLWRKTSFGTHSELGSRFVERMMTTVVTLRLQKRNVLDFLVEASEAALIRSAPPSLLPVAARSRCRYDARE